MAPSFDCAFSSLLCAEDNNSLLDDDKSNGDVVVDELESSWHRRDYRINHKDRSFDGGLCLPLQSEECLRLMLAKECQYLPKVDYLKRLRRADLDLNARKEAIDWIDVVHSHFGFGPLCAYLSISYLDRFLSAYELPKGKVWMMQLLAVACLSIAAKVEETEVPLSVHLQVGETRYVFEARTIQRIELLVLSTLCWKMQAITPFSFIDHFLHKINNDENPPRSLILQSIQLILSTIREIDFLEFRPSEIAAAVAIAAIAEIKTVDSEQAISVLAQHVDEERVTKCMKQMEEVSLIGNKNANGTKQSVPQSPIGVLDATTCLSHRSDESTAAGSASSANSSSQNTPDPKRRKLNTPSFEL